MRRRLVFAAAGMVLVMASGGSALAANAATRPHCKKRVVDVTTSFVVSLENLTPGAIGGTAQQVTVTLEPSIPNASYVGGELSVQQSTTTCEPAATETVSSSGEPGAFTPAPLQADVQFVPTCAQTLTITYSGAHYRSGHVRYVLRPDTWTVSPNNAPGVVTLTQP